MPDLGRADPRPRFWFRLGSGLIHWRRGPAGMEHSARTVEEAFEAAGIATGTAVIFWNDKFEGARDRG